MPQDSQINKIRSLNLDAPRKYLKDTEASYLLNFDVANPTSLGKGTPFAASEPLCEMDLPLGENYNNGRYYSPITNETYFWTFNSNQIHFIGRVNQDGLCQIVYHNDGVKNCLQLSADPRHEITQDRAYLHVEKSDCHSRDGKYLIWTNGQGDIGYLDVEASIATSNFTTPFFDDCITGCEPLILCVPQPCSCISAEFISLPTSESSLTNNILNTGFKFIFRWVYYDGRASEWSNPSTLYFEDASSCFYNTKGEARCMKLTVPAGNPLVEKVEIGFSKGDGLWYLTDTVEKYQKYNSAQQKWYDRQIAPEFATGFSGCHFDYTFCNNKQCQAIDPAEVSRVFNPIPRDAQGFKPIAKGLGFYNYIQGNCPIDTTEINKFSISQICQDDSTCAPEMRTIKVRALIQNYKTNTNQFVWRHKGAVGDIDDTTDQAWFGGFQTVAADPPLVVNGEHDQSFPQSAQGGIRNFIAYVEGTDYFAVMKQCLSAPGFTSTNEVGVLAGVDKGADFMGQIVDAQSDNSFYFQEATILVPKGMSGVIRLCSHKATGYDPNSSTQVQGVMSNIADYVPNDDLSFTNYQFEIPFSCGDTDIRPAFIIVDQTLAATNDNHASVATNGYIRDNLQNPLEGLEVVAITDTDPIIIVTDHNGFYHLLNWSGKILSGIITGEQDCDSGWQYLQTIALNKNVYRDTTHQDAVIANPSYVNDFYTDVKLQIIDCAGRPVPGLRIAMSGSKYQDTASDGVATWHIRNYSSRDRVISATVMSKYDCYVSDCNGLCNPCSPSVTSATPLCYRKELFTHQQPKITMPAQVINIDAAQKQSSGLKSGGEYPFGFVVRGDCGNISAVNELPNQVIDKVQKKGNYSFCSFGFNATGIALPDWGTCIDIVRGVNLNDYQLQWLVDKVEKTSDRKLKITIQSLNDYNELHFFKTNTAYQYLAGDHVEFIRNGDGKIFDIATNGLLNYQILSPFLQSDLVSQGVTTTADYFNQILIDDDGRLDKLVAGATIELQRQKVCVNQPTYFSVCASIPTVRDAAGVVRLVAESGTFRTFDTYLVQRQVGDFSIQSFESKTPSDFWGGTGIDDTGKPYFTDKYENEKRFGRNISISAPNQLNFFGDIVKTFDAPEQGDIVSLEVVDAKIILAIGENDTFLAQVSSDLVRVGSDGIIRAASPDSVISDAQPKVSGKYGCAYDDIGSILYFDGGATWVDSNRNAHVKHNYSEAEDMSEDHVQSWFRYQIPVKNAVNRTAASDLDKYRWVTGINQVTKSIYLTIKSLRHPAVNNDYLLHQNPNETIVFNVDSGDREKSHIYKYTTTEYRTFSSVTPEGYTILNLKDGRGCAFISYYQGIPWLHPVNANGYNSFFGQPVDIVACISVNKHPEKLKNFIALELQDSKMWYVKLVETDDPAFLSEIPPIRFKSVGDKWNASFLSNSNSLEGLYGTKMPSGYFASVTLIRDNSQELRYNTVDNSKRVVFSEIDLILTKFSYLEQSGLSTNL